MNCSTLPEKQGLVDYLRTRGESLRIAVQTGLSYSDAKDLLFTPVRLLGSVVNSNDERYTFINPASFPKRTLTPEFMCPEQHVRAVDKHFRLRVRHILDNHLIVSLHEMIKTDIAMGLPTAMVLEKALVWATRMKALDEAQESLDIHNFHGVGDTYASSYDYVRQTASASDSSSPLTNYVPQKEEELIAEDERVIRLATKRIVELSSFENTSEGERIRKKESPHDMASMEPRKVPEVEQVIGETVKHIVDKVMVDKRMAPAARDLLNAAMYTRGDFSRGALSISLREDFVPHLSEPEDSRNHNTLYRANQVPINGADFTSGVSSISDWDQEREGLYAPCQSSAELMGMAQTLTFINPADRKFQVPRISDMDATSCRTLTSSSAKRLVSEMYNVSPTTDVDAATHLPKVRNWETHLELDEPQDVIDVTDYDISPEVNSKRLFAFYQQVGNSSSSSASSSKGSDYPEPGSDY
jgi:hypothetical protein